MVAVVFSIFQGSDHFPFNALNFYLEECCEMSVCAI